MSETAQKIIMTIIAVFMACFIAIADNLSFIVIGSGIICSILLGIFIRIQPDFLRSFLIWFLISATVALGVGITISLFSGSH